MQLDVEGGDPVWVPGWAATLAQAAARTVAGERSAVIAVPDFRDVTDLERALLALLPSDRVVRFDAKQTNGQRAKALLRARTHAVVALGNRTAMYAPADDLGLIAMWDDGDASFIEQRAPYVHTRDVALVRAAQSGAALLFVSHARSTDVQRLVELAYVAEALTEVLPAEDANLWMFTPDRLLAHDTPATRIHDGGYKDVLDLIEAIADGVVV